MFSPAGLEQIAVRTGWSVVERMNVGDTVASDPSSPDHDERMFMLLCSSILAQVRSSTELAGFLEYKDAFLDAHPFDLQGIEQSLGPMNAGKAGGGVVD